MILVLAGNFGFSSEYVYDQMTWAEITESLQYVSRYVEPNVTRYKRYVPMGKWITAGDETSAAELRELAKKMRRA